MHPTPGPYGHPHQMQAQPAFGGPANANAQLASPGDVYARELSMQADPAAIARIEAYAKAKGLQLNWSLPLQSKIITARSGDLAPENNPAQRNFVLRYYFPYASYITRITASVVGLDLPDNTVQTYNDFKALKYVDFRLVRQNSETFTVGDGDGFAPAANWMGDGSWPYHFDLIMFAQRAESVILNGQLEGTVKSVSDIAVTIHYLMLPVGTQVSP